MIVIISNSINHKFDHHRSTGGHYNPGRTVHGGPNDQVRHVGDLGNVVADADGNVNTIFSDSAISLFGLQSIIGRAIVVSNQLYDN